MLNFNSKFICISWLGKIKKAHVLYTTRDTYTILRLYKGLQLIYVGSDCYQQGPAIERMYMPLFYLTCQTHSLF